MIIVFAGAGASKATSPNKYPTTVDFYNRLPTEIKSDAIFDTVNMQLRSEKDNKEDTIDIEEIIWKMDELLQEANAFITGRSLLGRFISQPTIQNLAKEKYKLGTLYGLVKEVKDKMQNITKLINTLVFSYYHELPNDGELENGWIPLISSLITKGYWIEFFTTNYDQVIESAIHYLGKQDSKYSMINTGIIPGVRPILDIQNWGKNVDYGQLKKWRFINETARFNRLDYIRGNNIYRESNFHG